MVASKAEANAFIRQAAVALAGADGAALPAAVTAEILAAAIAWGEAWMLYDKYIPDARSSQAARAARDAAFQAAERRLLAALRPAVPGL